MIVLLPFYMIYGVVLAIVSVIVILLKFVRAIVLMPFPAYRRHRRRYHQRTGR